LENVSTNQAVGTTYKKEMGAGYYRASQENMPLHYDFESQTIQNNQVGLEAKHDSVYFISMKMLPFLQYYSIHKSRNSNE
jgi:hypothetical protein